MKITEISGKQIRFSILTEGVERRIFSYFSAASDGSFAFHSYLPHNFSAEISSDSIESGQKFNVDDPEKIDFKLNKFNFHKSGRVTRRSSDGNSSHDDFNSMAFEKIPDAITLFSFIPTFPNSYPEIQSKKEYIELTQGKAELLPPNIQFFLAKTEYKMDKEIAKLEEGNLFVDKNILSEFELDLYIYVKPQIDKKYPKYEATAVITY